MKKDKGDKERLQHIYDAICNIESFTQGFSEKDYLQNLLVQSAVERQLEIIGEACANISDKIKKKHTQVEWNKIKAFRNIIAHEYFGVSSKQIWNVVQLEISQLKISIQAITKEI